MNIVERIMDIDEKGYQPLTGAIGAEAATEIERLRAAMALAYGYLWHVNNEPMAPVPLYSPEKAAYEARKVLRDMMTHKQRGEAINMVRALLGWNGQ
ncbi:MAG: hypothetical protein IPN69_08635 [Acidobacteria bacterium]|nr:hypothetical protein [Acidobacteriota bacterium]